MRHFNFPIPLLLLGLLTSSCSVQNRIIKSGKIVLQVRQFDTTTQKTDTILWYSDINFWFYDSMIIAARPTVELFTNEFDITTNSTKIENFTFIDLRRRTYTIYQSFSDTAAPIKKYNHPDTGQVEGGWGFIPQNLKKHLSVFWKDTLIKGEEFQVYKSLYTPSEGGLDRLRYYFLKKEKQNWWPLYFTLEHNITKKSGLAVTKRLDIIPNSSYFLSVEYVILRNPLNKKEMEIFNAWQKNDY
ncbi:MAG: hypothetical protein U0T11_06455 [Chitinophagaceae bacterium]